MKLRNLFHNYLLHLLCRYRHTSFGHILASSVTTYLITLYTRRNSLNGSLLSMFSSMINFLTFKLIIFIMNLWQENLLYFMVMTIHNFWLENQLKLIKFWWNWYCFVSAIDLGPTALCWPKIRDPLLYVGQRPNRRGPLSRLLRQGQSVNTFLRDSKVHNLLSPLSLPLSWHLN